MSNMYIRPESEVTPDYNFLMGYHTGVKKKWYHGIEGIYFVFNGSWSDPEVVYRGYAINETYLDCLWDEYNEEVSDPDYDDYSEWLRQNKELVFSTLDDIIDNYEETLKYQEAIA